MTLVKSSKHSGSIVAGLIFAGMAILVLAAVIISKNTAPPPAETGKTLAPTPPVTKDQAREQAEEAERRRLALEEEWILQRKQELEARRKAEDHFPQAAAPLEPPPPPPSSKADNSAPPPEPSARFDEAIFKSALETLTSETSVSVRLNAALKVVEILKNPYVKKDLAIVTFVLLARSPLDAGFAQDRLHVKSPRVEITYDGVFENVTRDFVPLRLRSGALVTASRSFQEAWTVQPPDAPVIADCRVTLEPDAPTRESALLKSHFAAFPPAGWPIFKGADHVRAGRSLQEALTKAGLPAGQATHALRVLAASHLAASLTSPSDAGEAESLLTRSEWTTTDGIWIRSVDATLLKAAAAIRGKRPEEAMGFSEAERTFRCRYLDLASRIIRLPLAKEEIPGLLKALYLARDAASSGAQARHMSALVDHLGKLKICNVCKGTHRIPCEKCAGSGQVRLICGNCNGRGVVMVAGEGGGDRPCGGCGGSGDRGTGDCSGCKGQGTRICKSCDAPFRCLDADDVGTWTKCPLCRSAALMGDRIAHICSRCQGLGSLLVPTLNKTADLR